LRVIQPPGHLLAVASDEGNRRTPVQEPDSGLRLLGFRIDLRRDESGNALDVGRHVVPGTSQSWNRIGR
jgi:hypothetical protein